MKTFLELSLRASPAQREALIPTLVESGCGGFEETDEALLCYFDATGRTDLRSRLGGLLRGISPNLSFAFREFPEENWNEKWERGLRPVEIGRKLVVKPSWTAYDNREGRIVLTIDPKMSFGTGYHESTRLILELIERRLPPGADFLDVGTGTGVLAIAAMKLGARSAAGIDIDEWSLANARENAAANGTPVEVSDRTPGSFPPSSMSAVAANIMLSTITGMLGTLHDVLRPGGVLFCSGLLGSDGPAIDRALAGASFTTVERTSENEWIALAALRTP